MKKWIAFILLLITVTGSFIPCCGVDDGCEDQFSSSTGGNDHEEEGSCSPFFSCTTCPGFVELTKPIQLIQPMFEKQVHHEWVVIFDLSAYLPSFWQPPRFG